METSAAADAVSIAAPLVPFRTALIEALPAAWAVATPDAFIFTMPGEELVQ